MRLLVVVFLALAIIGFTGCGSEPAPIAPKADVPLSNVGPDGKIKPGEAPAPVAAPAQPAPDATEEPEETEEGE